MRPLRVWWNTIVVSSQYNPPRFIELLMSLLALFLFGLWVITEKWPYLGLCLSYVVGSSTSILVREAITPSTYPRLTQVLAVLFLISSFYGFNFLIHYR